MATHERGAKLVLMERSDESVTSSWGGIEQFLSSFELSVSPILDLDPIACRPWPSSGTFEFTPTGKRKGEPGGDPGIGVSVP